MKEITLAFKEVDGTVEIHPSYSLIRQEQASSVEIVASFVLDMAIGGFGTQVRLVPIEEQTEEKVDEEVGKFSG